ncbi:MAG: hypothetical protein MRY78_19295 [Saprospiraceae bacterium]|nr:hypothetical protein [Saprospiraceae bacterium]
MKANSLLCLGLLCLFMACKKEVTPEPTPPPVIQQTREPQWQFVESFTDDFSTILALNLDSEDALWLSTEFRSSNGSYHKGLWQYQHQQWLHHTAFAEHYPNAPFIEHIRFDESQQLWFGVQENLVHFNGENEFTEYPFPIPTTGKLSMLETDQTAFWLAKGPGLARFRENQWQVIYTLPTPVQRINDVALIDDEFWISTNDGLYRSNNSNFEKVMTFPTPDGEEMEIHGIFGEIVQTTSDLWIATDQGLLQKQANGWQLWHLDNSPLQTNEILSLSLEGDHRLWIGTIKGMYRLQNEQWEHFLPPIISHCITCPPKVHDIKVDSRGRKWLLMEGGLIFTLKDF